MLDLPRSAGARARESRRIEDDGVEEFALSCEARQNTQDVVGDETMAIGREPVESEIVAATVERFPG